MIYPNFHQSNGLSEKFVQISKVTLLNAKEGKQGPSLAFLEYGTTPLENDRYSPAKFLKINFANCYLIAMFVLPDKNQGLEPKEKLYYDKHAIPLPEINVGYSAWVHMECRSV